MSWQCHICNHYTADNQIHNCINEERDELLLQNKKLKQLLVQIELISGLDCVCDEIEMELEQNPDCEPDPCDRCELMGEYITNRKNLGDK